MAEEKKSVKRAHNIIMENRKTLSISGVVDVDSFDDESVILFTEAGTLTIDGENLHINRLNIENGEVQIEGEIDSAVYSDDRGKKEGFFARIMR